jgi:ABC-2 type transport system ATP-binding protein
MDHGKILQTGSVAELAQVVGDGDIVTLRGAFTAVQLETVLKNKKVTVLNAAEQNATLSLQQDGINLATLLQKLGEGGIDVTDVSMQKPNLESVFLKLTGRELRD